MFCIRTSKKKFYYGANIIDAPLLNNNVCSVLFKPGNEFFVLMKSCDTNLFLLKEAISKDEDADYITISQISTNSLKDDIVFQLMLNSLGNYESPLLKFNNLTGHLYCFHPKWLIKRKIENRENVVVKVPCLELKLSSKFRLNMEVHTFTSERLRNKIEFKKKKFEEYPKYVLTDRNTLRRKLKSDKKNSFIMRQTKNKKTEITFLDIQNIDNFNKSKMGILTTVLENFNKKFSDIAHLEFESITHYKSLDYTCSIAQEKKAISNFLKNKSIKIVDCIDDEDSKIFCKKVCNFLFSKYGLKASYGKRVAKNNLNIRVIHNADFYADGDDPHKVFNDVAVQHITYEDFSENSKSAIRAVIHEMLIKDDLVKQKISLFDWSTLDFKEDIDFGIELTDQQYAFMTIHPDGTFNISKQTLNLLNHNEYHQYIEIFENAKNNSEKICGMVIDASGNINVIKDTGWFTIPEINRIKAELARGNTKLRNEEKRGELLSSCLDIKMFGDDTAEYYFVGTVGKGMKPAIQTAANIRKIEAVEDSILMFEKLLPLMNVKFVRNGQLTVLPFPFKYLREYANQSR